MGGRRTLLKAGAGIALVGAGALGWRAWDQGVFSAGQGPAYEAWDHWSDGPADAPQRLVAAAILAANPHNTQPWRFRLGAAGIDVFSDRTRNIGTIDPKLREMHIGIGCAIENLLLAARAAGWSPQLALFPNPADATQVARVGLVRGEASVSPLHAAIPLRHTNRGAYDTRRPLEPSVFAALDGLRADLPPLSVRWLSSAAERRSIGEHIVEASQAITADKDQSRDSGAWFRNGWDEIQRKRDGLTIDAQALPGWMRVAAKLLPPVSTERADAQWIATTRDVQVATAPAFGLLLARDPADNLQRVQGGRLWQRMHLWAQTQGLAMQPLNQMPERADRERSLGLAPRFQHVLDELAGGGDWHVLMPFRIGHPTVPARRSPRRHVDEVVIG